MKIHYVVELTEEVDKCQKNQRKKQEVNISIEDLKDEFYKQFNDKLFKNEETSLKAEEHFEKIKENIGTKTYKEFSVNRGHVGKIIKEISNGKSKGFAGAQPEMYKYAYSDELIDIISSIIEIMIRYTITPYLFNVGIIKPLVKDENKGGNDLNNLRPITISDTFANIYEKYMLLEIESKHTNNYKQFGFKKNSSCGHAVFVLNETIKLYKKKKKKIYVCAIDASKAFDKVDRKYLWLKLKDKVEPYILASLMEYYNDSIAVVNNNNEYSKIFKTSIGVKQGGPLSPRLFAMYVEDLIDQIENLEEGAQLNNIKIDIIMYADDILLVAPTLKSLQKLLNKTSEFGKKWEIKFNPTKTVYMEFGGKKTKFCIENKTKDPVFDGKEIKKVEKMKYLGMHYNNKLDNSDHLNKTRGGTFGAINKIKTLGMESNLTSTELKTCLYKTYCRPILYYGTENLVFNENENKMIQTTEGNIIKKSFGINKRSRTTNLVYGLDLESSKKRIEYLKLNFLKRLYKNSYTKQVVEQILVRNDKISSKSLVKEIKELTKTKEYNFEKILKNSEERLKEINIEIETIRNKEEIKKIKKILEMEGTDREKALSEALAA